MCSKWLPGLFLSLCFLASCSVKEDRRACPCRLALDFDGLCVTPVMLDVRGEEGYAHAQAVFSDTLLVLDVPRGRVSVAAAGGAVPDGEGSVRIPAGEEAPPLYLFQAGVDAAEDRLDLPVRLRKQFCLLELLFSGPPGYGPPFAVEVEGDYDGWLRDGTPLKGPFSRRLLPDGDGRALLRLPRQGDDTLRMHIVFSDRVVRTFSLGSYIAASGYDWTAPDLEDLTLQVDISLTSLTLSTDLWSMTEDIELWI